MIEGIGEGEHGYIYIWTLVIKLWLVKKGIPVWLLMYYTQIRSDGSKMILELIMTARV